MGESVSNRSRARSGAVFLFFACLYILSIGRGFYTSDGEVMFKTAAALVERHSLALEPDPGLPQIVRGHDGRMLQQIRSRPAFTAGSVLCYR